MLRIALKFPYRGPPRILRYRCSRLHVSAKLLQASAPETRQGKGSGGKFLLFFGTMTLVPGATIAYAKYDPEFRKWLAENVSYSEGIIKVVLQEEKPIYESLTDIISELRTKIWKTLYGRKDKGDKLQVKPAQKSEVTEEVIEQKDYKHPEENQESHSASLVELEKRATEAAKLAVEAQREAASACREHGKEIHHLMEESVDRIDSKIWTGLKFKSEKKDKALTLAEERALAAFSYLEKFKSTLENSHVSEDLKNTANHNIRKMQEELDAASKELNVARHKASIADKYWKNVELARKHFSEELETLFPSLRISDKKVKLPEAELDLFIFHAYRTVLYYQKELSKLQLASEERLQKIRNESGEVTQKAVTDALIQAEVDKERQHLELEFQKKILSLKAEAEQELRLQLKRQAEAHSDHLRDALVTQEMELSRHVQRVADEKAAEQYEKYKEQLASMIGRLKGFEAALKARADAQKKAAKSQILWGAVLALQSTLKAGQPGIPWSEQLRPLEGEVLAVKRAGVQDDELVEVVIDGIPEEAVTRGVYPENALRERFLKVERVAQRLALLPETGGSLPMYFLSYLQSFLLINAVNPIPQAELSDEPVDISSLDTYDILQRARYWLDRGNYTQTLKYMNLLKGASRKVASDWMNETRILLETQQAANTLLTHAAAACLIYL